MRLTSFTDFGLRALMHMAAEPQRSFSTAELAREFGLSRHHLIKIMAALAQAGIVTTRRGSGGGATLQRMPGEIGLGEVIRVLEAGQPLVECFSASGGDCMVNGRCRLKGHLRAAEQAFLASLDRLTLLDIALPPQTPPDSRHTDCPPPSSSAGINR